MNKLRVKTECVSCPTPIWRLKRGKYEKTPEYSEVSVVLNDGSEMTVGVCSIHTDPDKSALGLMAIKLRRGWQEEVDIGAGNAEWLANAGSRLTVTGVIR